MEGEGYVSAADFVACQGGLARAVQAILAWRTAVWSDRAVAVAAMLIQLHGLPMYRKGQKHRVASEARISRFLGYKGRTPLVHRAIKRLSQWGWIRPVGRTGPGRRRVFKFMAGEATPAPQVTRAEEATRPSVPTDPREALRHALRSGRKISPQTNLAEVFVAFAREREHPGSGPHVEQPVKPLIPRVPPLSDRSE